MKGPVALRPRLETRSCVVLRDLWTAGPHPRRSAASFLRVLPATPSDQLEGPFHR